MNRFDRGANGSGNIGFPDGLPKRKDSLYVLDIRSHRGDATCKVTSVFKLATMFRPATMIMINMHQFYMVYVFIQCVKK